MHYPIWHPNLDYLSLKERAWLDAIVLEPCFVHIPNNCYSALSCTTLLSISSVEHDKETTQETKFGTLLGAIMSYYPHLLPEIMRSFLYPTFEALLDCPHIHIRPQGRYNTFIRTTNPFGGHTREQAYKALALIGLVDQTLREMVMEREL